MNKETKKERLNELIRRWTEANPKPIMDKTAYLPVQNWHMMTELWKWDKKQKEEEYKLLIG